MFGDGLAGEGIKKIFDKCGYENASGDALAAVCPKCIMFLTVSWVKMYAHFHTSCRAKTQNMMTGDP